MLGSSAQSMQAFLSELTPSQVICSNQYFFENFAKCQLRDDISPQTQVIFMLLFCINLGLLGKNIMNLIVIKKLERIKKLRHMRKFNSWLMPTILFQILLFLNSFLQSIGFDGYSLLVYQIIASTQVLALNTLLALGGYQWMVMIFKMSFNNKKRNIVEAIFVLCCLLNLIFLLYCAILPLSSNLNDTTWWPDFQRKAQHIMALVTISTFVNGIFFAIGSLYASKYMTVYQNLQVSNQKLVCDLTLFAGIFSVIRIIQDAIQIFWPFISTLKENSVVTSGWGYPIYLLIYLALTNVIPVYLLLKRYTPSINEFESIGENTSALIGGEQNVSSEKRV